MFSFEAKRKCKDEDRASAKEGCRPPVEAWQREQGMCVGPRGFSAFTK